MKLIKSILTKNPCYTAGRKITVKGLMLHSVGCPQPKASVFINSWNKESYDNACVHGFIDGNDGTVYQTLPWNHRGWHCGSGKKGSGNNTHIGIEMCEPSCIRYTGGSSFTCSNVAAAKATAKRTYEAAVELFAMLCEEYNLNPLADGVIISHREGHARGIASNHGDPEHLWNGLGMGYTMDGFRKAVKAAMTKSEDAASGIQATSLKDMEESAVIAKIGALFTADQKSSGILASVSTAQFILESGYGKSELAQNANNCFGMKCSLSGNTWSGSAWDGESKYTKKTQEWDGQKYITITADFRKYPNIEKSIADHSAYLLNAMNGSKKRYEGLKGCTDYKKAVQIIKDGGYATSPTYVESICNIIDKWNLVKYDVTEDKKEETASGVMYRVQAGAYSVKANADKQLAKLKAAGFDTYMVTAGGMYKIQVGAYSKKANAEAMVKKLKAAGFDAFITTQKGEAVAATTETKKTVQEIAKEVIAGKWGNGEDRKKRLTAAGYDYDTVQAKVNAMLK